MVKRKGVVMLRELSRDVGVPMLIKNMDAPHGVSKQGVPLDPDARYFVFDSEHPKAKDIAGETRFSTVLKNEHFHRDQDIPTVFQPGDCLGVLNQGFVELQEVMGSDDALAEAARTSYKGKGRVQDNAGLLRYLMRHSHTTPMEMAAVKVRVCMPIVVYRQFFRHRTASQYEPEGFISNDAAFQKFSVQNEMSMRYVEAPNYYFVPERYTLQPQSTENKQGRSGEYTEAEKDEILSLWNDDIKQARSSYGKKLEMGLAKELARCNLPLTQYTLLVWKIDLLNLCHFLRLRLHKHAQFEVRQYAMALSEFVRQAFPAVWSAFNDYQLQGVRFSRLEMDALDKALGVYNPDSEARMKALKHFCLNEQNQRERGEFAEKLMLPVNREDVLALVKGI